MNQDVCTIVRMNANGVFRAEEHRNRAIDRRINLAIRILYRSTFTHGAAGESRVLDIFQFDELSVERAVQTNFFHEDFPFLFIPLVTL